MDEESAERVKRPSTSSADPEGKVGNGFKAFSSPFIVMGFGRVSLRVNVKIIRHYSRSNNQNAEISRVTAVQYLLYLSSVPKMPSC